MAMIRTKPPGTDTMSDFASSIVLKPVAENLWAGEADPNYGHLGGAGRFGGWTAAQHTHFADGGVFDQISSH